MNNLKSIERDLIELINMSRNMAKSGNYSKQQCDNLEHLVIQTYYQLINC